MQHLLFGSLYSSPFLIPVWELGRQLRMQKIEILDTLTLVALTTGFGVVIFTRILTPTIPVTRKEKLSLIKGHAVRAIIGIFVGFISYTMSVYTVEHLTSVIMYSFVAYIVCEFVAGVNA